MNLSFSRAILFILLLLLAFAGGWMLRGLKVEDRVNKAQPRAVFSEHPIPASLSASEPALRTEGVVAENSVLHNSDRTETEQELVEGIVRNIQSRNFQQVLLQMRFLESEDNSSPSSTYTGADRDNSIQRLGAAFLNAITDMGFDQYVSSNNSSAMEVGNRIGLLDSYSPYAQFFKIISDTISAPEVALSNFDALSSYYQEQITASELLALETWMIHRVESDFYENKDWVGLNQWYEALIARATDPIEIYRKQASLQYQTGRYIDSLETLDLVNNYSTWSSADESLYNKNRENIEKGEIAFVQLERLGEHFIASLRLNNRMTVRMLMDTGASISALDYRFVQSQGMASNGSTIRLSTASGQVNANLYSIGSVEFGDFQLANLEFAGIDLGGSVQSPYQGLLGMDVLGKFEFYLDQREAILYLNAGDNIDKALFGF